MRRKYRSHRQNRSLSHGARTGAGARLQYHHARSSSHPVHIEVIMKKLMSVLLFSIVVLALGAAIWHATHIGTISTDWNGDEVDGPLGALLGLVIGGGGMVIAATVLCFVALILGVVMAGVGLLLIVLLSVLAFVVIAALTPMLLPLLIPLAIVWFVVTRIRNSRRAQQAI
jgi:hypothetical protein